MPTKKTRIVPTKKSSVETAMDCLSFVWNRSSFVHINAWLNFVNPHYVVVCIDRKIAGALVNDRVLYPPPFKKGVKMSTVAEGENRHTYSILCRDKRTLGLPDNGNIVALDWNRNETNMWTASVRESGDLAWRGATKAFDGVTDAVICKRLVDHFGLGVWYREFPFAIIQKMSPQTLAKVRRAKECLCDLPRLEMRSDTAGNRVNAEDHPD